MWQQLLDQLVQGDIKALARSISFVENEQPGYRQFMQAIPNNEAKIIGITGPPGVGKSTLVDGLIKELVDRQKKWQCYVLIHLRLLIWVLSWAIVFV